jgi:alpha-mannosidase
MLIRRVLAMSLMLPLLTGAQTAVDRVAERLEFFSKGTIDQWKYSTDMKANPLAPGFNDSRWERLVIGQAIYPDSCWLRCTVVLPEKMLGVTVGGPLRFRVSVDDYGYFWANGTPYGRFPWNGDFVIGNNARPGDTLVLVVKAVNTGGPLRLLRAQLELEQADTLSRSIEGLALSLRVAQKLLSFDTYQTNARVKVDPGVDRSTIDPAERRRLQALLQDLASQVDVDALQRGSMEKFRASVAKVRAQMQPLHEFASRFTLFFDANAHIDAAWLWRSKETIEVCKRTFSSVLNMMRQRPDFTYTQSSAAYYDWMQRLAPDLFAGMRKRITEGRWEVIGGMWVEPDCNLPSGESWARHLLYGKGYMRKELGVDVKIGWNPDSFGYNANMPQFYCEAGIDAFITQKIGWNDTNVFPHRLFWWESPDGSRILSFFPFDYVNTVDEPLQLVDWLRQFEANTGFRKLMMLFGVGDHGGGPSLEMLARIDRLRELEIFPSIEYGTASNYLQWLRTRDLSSVPVWRDELYLEYHRGTFTTQAAMKRANREAEVLLTNTEKLGTLATMVGHHYGSDAIAGAWKTALFNQFHDILPGSSIREVYIDAAEEMREAVSTASYELYRATGALANAVNTSSARNAVPLLVFNTLAWDRSDIVEYPLERGDTNSYAVYTADAKPVASQIVGSGRTGRTLLFVAREVPAMGHDLYLLKPGKPAATTHGLSTGKDSLKGPFFDIRIDTTTGWLRSIVDLRTGRELLAGPGNELQLLEDLPTAWDAWNIGWTGKRFSMTFRGAEVIETGPVRSVVRVYHDFLRPGVRKEFPTEDFPSSFFTQDIILYNGLDRIDFVTAVDWWEDRIMLKASFPLTVSDSAATYEIPYGSIRRSTRRITSWEKAKVEVPAARWADVTSGGYGVSLLNTSKYGYDVTGNVMRLSLLRSPKWPDPTADRGKQTIRYALFPHAGGPTDGLTVRRGYELNTPLLPFRTTAHKGTVAARHSGLRLEPSTLVLTSLKVAEDGDGWVVQWYESAGKNATATLSLPGKVKSARLSNFLEEEGQAVSVRGTRVEVQTPPHRVMTVRVRF